MNGYLTSFLQAHRQSIRHWSLTENELVVDLKPEIDRSMTVIFFTDLITFVNPGRAYVNPRDGSIRLELN